jgi:hypothetical protein
MTASSAAAARSWRLAVTAFPATARGRKDSRGPIIDGTGPSTRFRARPLRAQRQPGPGVWPSQLFPRRPVAGRTLEVRSSTGPARARAFEHGRFERGGSPSWRLAATALPATARGRHQSSRLGSSTGPARARAFEHDRFERGGSPSWRLAATALPATARGRHQSSRLGSSTGPARARGFEHARFERSGSPVLAFGVKSSVAPGLTVRANPGPRRIHPTVAVPADRLARRTDSQGRMDHRTGAA